MNTTVLSINGSIIGDFDFKANLSRAGLSGADLSGAYLSGADLSGANLSGASLTEVNLLGAIFSPGWVITRVK